MYAVILLKMLGFREMRIYNAQNTDFTRQRL